MTTVVLVDPAQPGDVQEGVQSLLRQVDREFCPPLSSRPDTSALSGSPAQEPSAYVEAMKRESWLLAVEQGCVVGILSFVLHQEDRELPQCTPALHATTVAVAPRRRRAGIATLLYDALADQARRRGVPYLTTRTWTTNGSHIGVLAHRGFVEVARQPGERAPGVGSVYFACRVGAAP